jgi:hypothetical protein
MYIQYSKLLAQLSTIQVVCNLQGFQATVVRIHARHYGQATWLAVCLPPDTARHVKPSGTRLQRFRMHARKVSSCPVCETPSAAPHIFLLPRFILAAPSCTSIGLFNRWHRQSVAKSDGPLPALSTLQTTQLNGGASSSVDTQLCDPTAPAATATIPAGAPWDATALARAVRFSRYASTLHGCLPGMSQLALPCHGRHHVDSLLTVNCECYGPVKFAPKA